MPDILLFVFGPILIFGVLTFLWNLLLAPARLAAEQNQRYDAVAQELKDLRQTIAASPPSGLFVVQHIKHELVIRDERGGMGWLDPSVRPKAGTLVLQVEVSIDAIPARVVERLELALMGQRVQSGWESREVHSVRQRFIYFDIPEWVNPGPHTVKLVARSHDEEVLSPDFVVDIPRNG